MIEIGADGMPSYTLTEVMKADGTERLGYGTQQGAAGPYVNFYAKSVPNGAASLDESKPVFKSIVFMRLQHPGERDVLERPATRADANRFPGPYRLYVEGRQDVPDGVPLHVLFPNHHDVVQALNFHRIHTCEQLANLNDTQMQNLGMGGLEWSQKARRYLEHLQRGEGFAKYEEQLRRQAQELERAQTLNQDLSVKLQALTVQVAQLMQVQMAAGGVMPMGVMTHGMGVAPAAAAMPQPMQRNGFAAAAPHEIGADDNVPQMQQQQPPVADLSTGNDSFLDEMGAGQNSPSAKRKR